MQNKDPKQAYEKLVIEIKSYFKKNKFEKAVIGLSGGIDSAVSAKLVADAIGKNNVHALIMPLRGLSSEENIMDAVEFCTLNGIDYSLVYINDFIKQFGNLYWEQGNIAKMNTASRIRAVVLYNYANSHNALVIGTSNKTEILTGYFTKYGDGAIDVEVIGDLFKTEVRELAKFLKIPEKIISKAPTAELYHGQTDEKELGVTYEELDKILGLYVKGKSINEVVSKGFNKKTVESVFKRIRSTEHKRNMPAVVKIF